MKRNAWTLVLLLSALICANAAASSALRRSGVRFEFKHGPICKPGHCTYIPLVGCKIKVFKGKKMVGHGVTNRAGAWTFYGAPGRYSANFSGMLDGRPYAKHGAQALIVAGAVVPDYEIIGPA